MDDLLHRLEQQINKIIQQQHHVKGVNQALQQRNGLLANEKSLWVQAQQKLFNQLNTIVAKLKLIKDYHE